MSIPEQQRNLLRAMGFELWHDEKLKEPLAVPKGASVKLSVKTKENHPMQEVSSKVVLPDSAQSDELTRWSMLEGRVKACQSCSLAKTRKNVVFGRGSFGAKWLFVGEAPGAQEDQLGQAFVGRAGRLLDSIFRAMELGERDYYIANVLKCRPPSNRDPLGEEVQSCNPFLKEQIDLLKPRLIVAMGRFAAQSMLKVITPIGKLRDELHDYQGIPLIVTYHPAYLLRSGTEKARVWDDMWLAKEHMARLESATP